MGVAKEVKRIVEEIEKLDKMDLPDRVKLDTLQGVIDHCRKRKHEILDVEDERLDNNGV